jgi:CHASE1-domain containing sensor protein
MVKKIQPKNTSKHSTVSKKQKRQSRGFLFSIIVIIITVSVIATQVYAGMVQQSNQRFMASADKTLALVESQLNRYDDILYQARGFYQNAPTVTQQSWDDFFRSQQVSNRYDGVSSINFVKTFTTAEKDEVLSKLRQEPLFGGAALQITPIDYSGDDYAVITLSHSDNDIAKVYGFNLLSTADRRQIYALADQRGVATTSNPSVLKSGFKGYYSLLKIGTTDGATVGFVVVSYRIDDVLKVLFKDSTITSFKVMDATDQDNKLVIYESPQWNPNQSLKRIDIIDVGGRAWSVQYSAPENFDDTNGLLFLPLGIVGSGAVLIIGLSFWFAARKHRDEETR